MAQKNTLSNPDFYRKAAVESGQAEAPSDDVDSGTITKQIILKGVVAQLATARVRDRTTLKKIDFNGS